MRRGWIRADTISAVTLVLLLMFASRAAGADVPETVRSAGYGSDEWQKLTKGKVITRMARAQGDPPVSEGSGAFVTSVPWRHAFDQLGRIEEMPNYSSCLKAMQILMRVSRAGRIDIKARETHKTLWIAARYTLDYQEDLDRREIRWKLDPAAQNDVTRMSGSWAFIPLDGTRTLVTYRLIGSSGRALPAAIEDFFAARMLPSFLKEVRQQIEKAHARGAHQ